MARVRKEAEQEGAPLDADTVAPLILGMDCCSVEEVRLYDASKAQGKMVCSERQCKAYENVQKYIRYRSCLKDSRYSIEGIRLNPIGQELVENTGKFWADDALKRLYQEQYGKVMGSLFGDMKIWGQLAFRVTDDGLASEYFLEDTACDDERAFMATKEFIRYMDKEIKERKVWVYKKGQLQDFGMKAFGSAEVDRLCLLNSSESANALHMKLKTLYEMTDDE